ncbi:MAG: hypothetical protein Q4B59_02890 [Lachnospiraceae bacterium]|nr:hypothetical protein [Lachnospiraceae bacterium]
MQQVTINNSLKISFDEGFHVMNEEELGLFFFNDYPNRFGITDESRHMTMTIVWNKPKLWVRPLASARVALSGTQTILSRSVRGFQKAEELQTMPGGSKSEGFVYHYDTDERKMTGLVQVVKYKGCLYTIYGYARRDEEASAKKLFVKILESMSWQA